LFFKKIGSILQILVLIAGIYFFLVMFNQKLDWNAVWDYRKLFFNGWLITIAISLASLFLSVIVGLLTALCSQSKLPLLTIASRLYVEIIRGTPLLVQILFFYYVVAHEIGLENRYVAGVIILSLFNGAYIAEMMRSGIEHVSATQIESAKAIGLSKVQSYRFVIFPQAIRQVIPNLAGQFASIIKDSSLLSIIGINELTNSAQQINSVTYSTLEVYLPLGLAYLLLTLPISLWSKNLEKRFDYES
jgi:polar amino acid transport system permease protein